MCLCAVRAAANGSLNEPVLSVQSLGRAFGPLQQQVAESIGRQERIIAETQELYQPWVQVHHTTQATRVQHCTGEGRGGRGKGGGAQVHRSGQFLFCLTN